MKGLVKTNLVIVVMFTTMLSFANEFTTLTKEKTKKITNVTFENVKKGSMLLIKDHYGLILFKELIENSGEYSKGFDLTALPDGNYYFELYKEVEIKIIPFEVLSNVVAFDKTKESTINKPFVTFKEGRLLVSKLALENQPLEIKIYDKDSNLIYSEKLLNGKILERIYDVSKVEKGNYKIVMKSDGREFVKRIEI
ncbi:MAG: hypothetical protein WBM92_07640 [Aureibaculum sp.]